MKKSNFLWLFTLLILSFTIVSCGNNPSSENPKENETKTEAASTSSESQILLNHFNESGDLLNKGIEEGGFPKIITAKEVNDELGGYILVIDLRGGKDFAAGHIEGAINIKLNNLLYYFQEDLDPEAYDKIVLVCYSGQTSSYAAGVLNLMGYNTVFSMKWGMCSWNEKFSGKWQENSSSDYIEDLQTAVNAMPTTGELASINTGKTEAKEIMNARAQELFDMGFAATRIKIGDLFVNLSDYFIVNYTDEDIYKLGHLEGAVNYTPKSSFGINQNLNTLPNDKPIAVVCYTGQNAAFTTAYLRMLGYDAYIVLYGTNGFMHSIIKENGKPAFSNDEINNFEYVETEFDASSGDEGAGGC